MFGSTPGGAFGASPPNPFGASSAPAFGQAPAAGGGLFGAKPFGAAPSPFGGGQPTGGGLFGNATPAPTTPAFGATPAFGQTSSAPAFGGTATFGSPQQPNPFGGGGAFGATQSTFGSSAFGASSAPAFGAASTPAFGAASAPAFGSSTPAFSATQSAFGTNTFGATQPAQPAFGTFGQTAAAFGASTGSAFGATATPAFGAASPSPFGQTSSAFGAASSTPAFGAGGFGAPGFGTPQKGTRWKRFEATPETDGSTTGVQGKFQSMTPMKEYAGKSFEELRWEDYQNNDKGGPAPAAAGGTMFGQQPATPSPFGGIGGASPFAPATPSAFGAGSSPGGSIFGASTQASPFGQAATTSAFGTTSTPAFGSNAFGGGAQPSPFGAPAGQQASVFGAQPSGSAFGTSTTPAFGGTNAFGTPATQSTFGSTPFGSTSAFGAPSAAGSSIFGQNTGTFGTGSAFGSGAAPSTMAFGSTLTGGAFGAPSASAFGAPTSSSIFGQTSAPSMFGGQTGGAFNFGGAQTKPAGLQLNMPSSSGNLFGNPTQQQQTSAPAFGSSFLNPAPQPAQGSIFGGGGAFGTPQPSASPFNFAQQPTGASPFSFAPQPQQQTAGVAQPTLQPSPVAAPYGMLPAMPQISITRTGGGSPAVQYGISTLPLADRAPPVVRTAGMLTPRHITPRSRIRLQARKVATRVSPGGKSGLFGEALEQSPNPRTDTLFGPRLDNPRTLFIREQTVDFSLTSDGDTPVKRLTNGETPQKQLTANGETPAKQSEAGSPSTPGARSTPGGPSDTPMSRGGETPVERTPHQNGQTPSPVKDKGKQPIREEEHEGPSGSGAANGSCESVDALLPKLRSEEYYTEPKLQELAAKERAERGYLRRVPGFTVGHKRFGSVRFLGETDVRRLDMESIILFHDKEVVVYPDEEHKPEVGQGLNKAAEVSVLNVKRFDKKTGKAITEGPALDRFEKILREKTAEQGATFLGWDRERGEWRFRVEHFSKYGLYLDDDDDDEDDDMVTSADGNADGAATSANGGNNQKAPAEAEGSELTFGGARGLRGEEHEHEEVFSREGPALAHSLPRHLGLDPVRMHQMRATLFAEDNEEAARRQRAMRTPGLRAQFVPPGMLSPEKAPARGVADVEEGGTLLAVWQRKRALPGRTVAPSPARGAAPLAITGPETTPAKRARVTVGFKEAEATLVEHSRAGVDAGLFLGRSFGVGWGPGGVLVHAGGGSASADGSQEEHKPLSSKVQVETVALSAVPLKPSDWFGPPLIIHRSRAIQEEGEGARRLSMQCDREQLSLLCQLYGEIAESQSEADGVAAEHWVVARHEQSVWRLVDVLFSKQGREGSGFGGEEQSDDEDMELEGGVVGLPRARGFEGLEAEAMEDEEVHEMERRAALSRWVQQNARSSADRDLDEIARSADGGKGKRPEGEEGGSPMKAVLAHLTAFRLEDAVGVAIAAGDVRLATLIAQSGGSVEERADVACQVSAWQSLHVVDHIDDDRLRVYKLLGGDVDGALEGALPVDWKRYLGLLIWYGLPPNATIPEIVSAYKARWTTGASSVPAPLPLYVEEGRRLGLPEPQTAAAAFDTSYYLLLLYGIASVDLASMQKMLRSASSTPDWLDHRLSWHLYSVLSAIGVPLPSSAEDLHMSFAAQLEAAGLCEWAVYVALHIEDDGLREQSVKELLGRHCEEWSGNEEKEALLMELNIPEEWMHEAQAQLSLANHDESAGLEHLLGSCQWGPAHHLFMTAVAPKLFSEGAHDSLIEYAEALAAYSDEVADWSIGGGLYLDYYQMQEALKAKGDERRSDLAGLEQRTAACQSVFTSIAKARVLWTGGSAEQYLRLVYARMADDLSRLLRIDTDRSAPTEALAAAAYTALLATPVPQDARACRAHDAVAHFTHWLAEPIA